MVDWTELTVSSLNNPVLVKLCTGYFLAIKVYFICATQKNKKTF